MRSALEAAALDALEAAGDSGCYGDLVLVSDRTPLGSLPSGARLALDDASRPFDFGNRLTEVVTDSGCESFAYVGAGAVPLWGAEEFAELARQLERPGPLCVTNNFYSADLFALRPASLVDRIADWPLADNGVPRALREQLGVQATELPRTAATQLNLDSPIDLAAMRLADVGGRRLCELIEERIPTGGSLERAAEVFCDPGGEVLVAGRVSSRAWRYLESETACRVRLLSEERGMTAAGRDAAHSARSMLAQLIEAVGAERFFNQLLPEICDAAFIDVRPVIAHLGWSPSAADRFACDLSRPAQVQHAGLRALVTAAAAAPVPVVLGGHSLVAGVLMLLNDWTWGKLERAAQE